MPAPACEAARRCKGGSCPISPPHTHDGDEGRRAAFLAALGEHARQLDWALTPAQLQALATHYVFVVRWNRRMNLTAVTEPGPAAVRHAVDSLMLLQALPAAAAGDRQNQNLLDLGTGAGFPGVPVKIVRPEWRVTLLDATLKKVKFLRAVVEELALNAVAVIHGRAEELGQHPRHRQRYEVVTARAVAPMPVLAEYALPLTAVGGRFLAMRGPAGDAEGQDAAEALTLLGGRVDQVIRYDLPDGASRTILVVRKEGPTPPNYPRRPGIPRRSPL